MVLIWAPSRFDIFPRRGMGTPTSAIVDKPFHEEGILLKYRLCICKDESTNKFSLFEIDEDIHSQHEGNEQKLEISERKSTTTLCSKKKKEANKLKKKLSRFLYQQGVTRIRNLFGIHSQTKLTTVYGIPNWPHKKYSALLRFRRTPAYYDGAGQASCGQWTTLPLDNGWPKWPKSFYVSRLTIAGLIDFRFIHVYEIQKQPMLSLGLPKNQELYAAGLSGFYKNLTKPTDGLPHKYLNWPAAGYFKRFRCNPRLYNKFSYWSLNGYVTGLTVNPPWKIPTPFDGLPKWRFLNRYAARLTACSLKKSGMGAHTELWFTSIGSDLEDQHQEGFSASPELEPSLTTLASGDTLATDGITSTIHNQHLRIESKMIDPGAPSNCDKGALTRSRSTSISTDLENQLHVIDGNKVLQDNMQKHCIEAFAKSCSTSIHTDLQDQLQVVDGNKVLQQSVQEAPPELKPPTTNLADEDIIARDGATPLICAYDQHNHTWNKPSVHGNPSKMGLGSLSELCSKTTDNDLEDQLLVVDGNNILQQSLQESFSAPPELNLASGDVIVSDGGSLSGYEEEISDLLPFDILCKAAKIFGENLNVVIRYFQKMSRDKVKFHVYREEDSHNLGPSFTKEVPVYDLSDHDRYPEVYDANCIMQHMHEHQNLCKYAEILDCRHPEDLKQEIDQILERLPGRRTSPGHCPTFGSLCSTLQLMLRFIEQSAAGLFRRNEDDLVEKLNEGYEHLENILRAYEARQNVHP